MYVLTYRENAYYENAPHSSVTQYLAIVTTPLADSAVTVTTTTLTHHRM